MQHGCKTNSLVELILTILGYLKSVGEEVRFKEEKQFPPIVPYTSISHKKNYLIEKLMFLLEIKKSIPREHSSLKNSYSTTLSPIESNSTRKD